MQITLTIPAQAAYVHLLRAVVSSAAAKQGLGIDAIDDFTLAVDEAAAKLITTASRPNRIFMQVFTDETMLRATLSSDADEGGWPPSGFREGLSWQVLRGLTDEAEYVSRDGHPAISIAKVTSR